MSVTKTCSSACVRRPRACGSAAVDFSLFPHLDHESFPENSLANAEQWAAKVPVPTYAIDDQTAVRVTDGTLEVVSEGHWNLFCPQEGSDSN